MIKLNNIVQTYPGPGGPVEALRDVDLHVLRGQIFGVIGRSDAGPHVQIFEQVKNLAEKGGLKIQVVEFSDYIQPKAALAAAGLEATPLDIVENPKKLKFVELPAGLHPGKDAIAQENTKSPYVNLIAVRVPDHAKPWVSKLVELYQSEEICKFVLAEFKGAA